jgi:transcriptional regulator with XRE-family HTH domain
MRSPTTFGGRLHALRLAKGLSQVALAGLIGRHPTAIGPYERDEYEPPREIVERLARLLDTTPEYLAFGRHATGAGLSVAGVIEGDAVREVAAGGTLRELASARLAAFELADDAMLPVFRPGQLVLCAAAAAEPAALVGRSALVTLDDGRRLLRRLAAAGQSGRLTLAAYNAPPIHEVTVTTAQAVLGTLEGEALVPRRRGPITEPRSQG